MLEGYIASIISLVLYAAVHVIFIGRVLLRPHRDPASRMAWVVVILSLPVAGIVAYILLGETNIGRRRVALLKGIVSRLSGELMAGDNEPATASLPIPENYQHLFQAGKSVNGLDPVGGNTAKLLADSNAAIDAMVADIDAATDHVHLMFYIWLPDNNGCKIVEALKRAAARGINCRAMADDMGSRRMIRSEHWQAMAGAGVKLAAALPINNPLVRPFKGRVDLRNHRKIVVIDNRITYCGSQNCADPEFLIKKKYAPWVDLMMRFVGPIARQNQFLFACDWEAETGEAIGSLLSAPLGASEPGLPAQVIGTGPNVSYSAMPEIFESLIFAARNELVITTPYYVPDESMQAALCACARRGVATTIVFPEKNDSRIVSAASKSYYAGLLAAGVRIFEYQGGLLHSKSLTIDGEITLIGSANMDRRSFDLNFENNILFFDPALTNDMLGRQQSYIAQSVAVTEQTIKGWSWYRRLWNNAIAMLGPVM
ncbi:cardiolipin synthase [Deltaproteobacteria bacterium]|nr:cardiolipin synthase [Deltaproteobacteria bacterium]